MDPTNAQLGAAVAMQRRILTGLVLGGLLLLVVVIGANWWQSYTGRAEVVDTQRLGCVRGLLDRADSIDADLEDASFRGDASKARAGDAAAALLIGDKVEWRKQSRTSRRYAKLKREALDRAARRKQRLLGADLAVLEMRVTHGPRKGLPTAAAVAEAKRACGLQYPKASPWPWAQPNAPGA